jgi:hypothetical protein
MMLCLGVLVLSVPLVAKADEWNKQTIMTFNQPVEVPNMVLNKGTYEFRLLDSASDRRVVQILNADGTHLYENVLAIPAYRVEPTGRTVVTFEERAEGAPEAVATWFYPGDNSGVEFVYPKVNSFGLTAKETTTPTTPPIVASYEASKPAATAPQTNATAAAQAKPATFPSAKPEPVKVAQATTTQPKPAASTTTTAVGSQKETPKQLPKTASRLPLLVVLGLLSLGGSASIHVFGKQSV